MVIFEWARTASFGHLARRQYGTRVEEGMYRTGLPLAGQCESHEEVPPGGIASQHDRIRPMELPSFVYPRSICRYSMTSQSRTSVEWESWKVTAEQNRSDQINAPRSQHRGITGALTALTARDGPRTRSRRTISYGLPCKEIPAGIGPCPDRHSAGLGRLQRCSKEK